MRDLNLSWRIMQSYNKIVHKQLEPVAADLHPSARLLSQMKTKRVRRKSRHVSQVTQNK
jgi:hypothetical protein